MPSQIRNFQELIAMLTLQKLNLGTYLTQCNAAAGDVTEITNELNNLNAMAVYAEQTDGYKKAIFEIKQALYNGDPLESIPPFPANITPPTLTGALSGALSRTRDRNARFKAGPGYTDAIGQALGLVAAGPPIDTPIQPVKPIIDVFPAESGYDFAVVVTNRKLSDQWELLIRRVGATAWTTLGSRTTKSGDFKYVPPAAEAPDEPISYQLQVRVQLKKNDEDYGTPSDIVLATVNP